MKNEDKKTPEELAQEVEERERVKEARKQFLIDVKNAVNSASTDPNVRLVLRYVLSLSGYQANPTVLGATGDVMISSTIYNVGRESLYHDLRKSMSAETKNLVERSE